MNENNFTCVPIEYESNVTNQNASPLIPSTHTNNANHNQVNNSNFVQNHVVAANHNNFVTQPQNIQKQVRRYL